MKYFCLTFILLLPHFFFSQKTDQKQRLVISPNGHFASIQDLNFSPDGKEIISVSQDKTICIWDANTAELLQTIRPYSQDGSVGQLFAGDLSPDGVYYAFGGYLYSETDFNWYYYIYNLKDNKINTVVYHHKNVVADIKFSPDGSFLTIASLDSTLSVWKDFDKPNPSLITDIRLNYQPSRIVITNDSKVMYVAGMTGEIEKIVFSGNFHKTGNISRKRIDTELKRTIQGFAVSPDGKYLVTGGFDNIVLLLDSAGTFVKKIGSYELNTTAINFCDNGNQLYIHLGSTHENKNYGIKSKGFFYSFPECRLLAENNFPETAVTAVCSNGNHIAAGDWETSTISVVDVKTHKIKTLITSDGTSPFGTGFSNNLELGVGYNRIYNDTIFASEIEKIFDFESLSLLPVRKNKIFNRNYTRYKDLELVRDGRNSLKLYKNGTFMRTIFVPQQQVPIMAFSFTPNGNIILGGDYRLCMVDTFNNLVRDFIGFSSNIFCVSITDNGKYLAATGSDEIIRLWNLEDIGTKKLSIKEYEKALINYFGSPEKLNSYLIKNSISIQKLYDFNVFNEVDPLVSLFISKSNEWVCWTYNGYYTSSVGGDKYIGWQLNSNIQTQAKFFTAEQLFNHYFRPDIVKQVILNRVADSVIIKQNNIKALNLEELLNQLPEIKFMKLVESEQLKRINNNNYKSENNVVKLKFTLREKAAKTAYIKIYLNDKLIENLNTSDSSGFEISLINGKNKIRISATDINQSESNSDEITIQYDGIIRKPDLYILSVGLNKYKNSSYNLVYAQPDAFSFNQQFENINQSVFGHIYNYFIEDQNATKENIGKTFNEISGKAKEEDLFIFYYAGHGMISENDDGGNDFYLILHEVIQVSNDLFLKTKALSAIELLNASKLIKAQKQLFILDACHSGQLAEQFSLSRGIVEEKALMQLAKSAGIFVISASGVDQYAQEFNDLKHGVFTYSILEGLNGNADILEKDDIITIYEIIMYVSERVPELINKYRGMEQFPKIYMKGDDFPVYIYKK